MRGSCSIGSPAYVGLAALTLLLGFLLLRRRCLLPSSTFGFIACGLGFFVFLRVTKVHPSLLSVGASWLFAPNDGCAEGAE